MFELTPKRLPSLAGLIVIGGAVLGCDSEVLEPPADMTVAPALARSWEFSAWSPAVRLESAAAPAHPEFNTASLDGCPFASRDGKTFYMASNRPGGLGGIDIWVSNRASESDPWGEPVNVGAPINSEFNDFCPTIDRDGHRFFFVSNRPQWGVDLDLDACGGADIYVTRFREDGSIDEPMNLGCHSDGGPNSAADEASPFPLPQSGIGPVLYFSSARAGGFSAEDPGAVTGDQDVYMSRSHGGVYGAAELVPGVNGAFEDAQPNVRRDGLEIFFFSNRTGNAGTTGTLGMADIFAATRARTSDPWSTPVNLGSNVNTGAAETRPSLSWDGTTLYFGSTRTGVEGVSDIYMTTRQRLSGGN